jgi:hypothetical protein
MKPAPLPASFTETRDGLHRLACYVIAPARRAATGRIGLRPTEGGFGTPPFGTPPRQVRVKGDQLVMDGSAAPITTLTAAAAFVGVELSPDPGVGSDLPPFAPDAPLAVDAGASAVLGDWYALGGRLLVHVEALGEAQLWPEHFDLGASTEGVNAGFSPGDGFHGEPYVYVGPWDTTTLDGPFWNAPFGAYLPYDALLTSPDAEATALEFLTAGLHQLLGPARTDPGPFGPGR